MVIWDFFHRVVIAPFFRKRLGARLFHLEVDTGLSSTWPSHLTTNSIYQSCYGWIIVMNSAFLWIF